MAGLNSSALLCFVSGFASRRTNSFSGFDVITMVLVKTKLFMHTNVCRLVNCHQRFGADCFWISLKPGAENSCKVPEIVTKRHGIVFQET